jgi:unsaturated rhamnogalacturonyl hydrolase
MIFMKKVFFVLLLLKISVADAQLDQAEQLIATSIKLWPDSFGAKAGGKARWSYDQGVILKGVEGAWKLTGKGAYFNYIQHSMDFYVREDGSIYDYKPDEYNIDHINNGKMLLLLYRVTGKEKYKKAVDLLRSQLKTHPRINEGGFWHKKIYPNQMWLDGLYMGQPFYAEYAATFHDDKAFDDITRQFVLMEQHARDNKTGLLFHAWDASKEQLWANKITGKSPHVWARAMGWYGMAMVDVLDHFPMNHPGRDSIIKILNRYAIAVLANQDKTTSVWYDILDMPKTPKNYIEASASSMFVYTLLKGIRKGYLPSTYVAAAKKGYVGLLSNFIKIENGQTNLHGTVSVSGLGGKPYRDGSFDYYMSEPVVVNDAKGMGAFIQASVEMELANIQPIAKGKEVVVDRYFNNEWKKDATGKLARWHYTWEDVTNSGFSFWGSLFEQQGAVLKSLDIAPSKSNLPKNGVYIVVDPDHIKDNPKPNFMDLQSARSIADWVKAGGVLVMMANDSNNCDLSHFNILAKQFGIEFTNKSINMVKGNEFETGAVYINKGNGIFTSGPKLHIKEISTLLVSPPAKTLALKDSDVVIATCNFGKGKVFAIGDPWLYNEYVDGRKLPAEYQNFSAAKELSKWLLTNSVK